MQNLLAMSRKSRWGSIYASHGSITLPMKSGALAWSFHSSRRKGRRALKEGKERENDMVVTALASTPCSVSARTALCLASPSTRTPSGERPHKLAPSKSDDRPNLRGRQERVKITEAEKNVKITRRNTEDKQT